MDLLVLFHIDAHLNESLFAVYSCYRASPLRRNGCIFLAMSSWVVNDKPSDMFYLITAVLVNSSALTAWEEKYH